MSVNVLGSDSISSKNLESNLELNLMAPTIFDKEAIQSLPRHYIITQLKEAGYANLAKKLPPASNPEEPIHTAFKAIADTLNEERKEQFHDMINILAVEESTLKETYDTVVAELFKGESHWGRVVTFIVFTSHVVLHCAKKKELRHRVPEIVQWADEAMHERLHHWIEEQGGWQALLEHYDVESWRVSLSAVLFGLGVGASVVAGGLIALKKLL